MANGDKPAVIKTAVIGASGYVGRHLWQAYRAQFPDCVGTAFSGTATGLTRFDIRDPDIGPLQLEETGHEAVLIASARPMIGDCEKNPAETFAVNVKGTLELLRQLGRTGLHVIFLSSDYVFDGTNGPHDDDRPPNPSTEYGRHKAKVEREIPALAPDSLVVRLSKIYGVSEGDSTTLLGEIASKLAAGKRVQAAHDQIFCPTNVNDLVKLLPALQQKRLRGVLNLCNPERWSRFDIAAAMARAMRVDSTLVERIALYDLAAMAGRPLDTSMRISRLERELAPRFAPILADIEATARLWRGTA